MGGVITLEAHQRRFIAICADFGFFLSLFRERETGYRNGQKIANIFAS